LLYLVSIYLIASCPRQPGHAADGRQLRYAGLQAMVVSVGYLLLSSRV
jgi:hypothetical protein